jgi:uncharacterized membrane protein
MSDKHTFTDWILDLPVKVFFWGATLVMFSLWAIAMIVLLIYLHITRH